MRTDAGCAVNQPERHLKDGTTLTGGGEGGGGEGEKDLDTWDLLKDCAAPALSLDIPSLMSHLHTHTHTHTHTHAHTHATHTPDEVCDFTSQFARVCVS